MSLCKPDSWLVYRADRGSTSCDFVKPQDKLQNLWLIRNMSKILAYLCLMSLCLLHSDHTG